MRYKKGGEGMLKDVKLADVNQACERYHYSKNYMRKIAEEANAVVRIGHSWRLDIEKMDAWIDSQTQ